MDEAEPFNMSNLASRSKFRRMDYATTTTWGGFVPWLVANAAVFVDVVVASNEYVPFPVIAVVRLTSTHVPTVTAPTEATGLPEMAGLLPQITVLSVQSFETRYQSPPRARVLDVEPEPHRGRRPLSPFRVNLMSDRYSAGLELELHDRGRGVVVGRDGSVDVGVTSRAT